MRLSTATQLTGGALLVGGCFALAIWLGLCVAGVLLMLAAEAMEQTP